jgi:molybdate transport system substrate-binding protein
MQSLARALVVTAGLLAAVPAVAAVTPPLRVAAASDLAQAFEAAGAAYERATGQKVTFSFGSSGLLAKQLREGAPFDLFAAADLRFVDEVIAAGACDAKERAVYARGRLVILVATGEAPASPKELAAPRFRRIAIANPDHAPYGRAAVAALGAAGVLDEVRPRLVYAESVLRAQTIVSSGNADAGLVARSLVVKAPPRSWALVDGALHPPIEQALTVCGRDEARRAAAAGFARWLRGEAGRAILRSFGFEVP